MRRRVDGGDGCAQAQGDVFLRPELLGPDHDPLEALVAREIFLGERRPLVGRRVVAADHQDRTFKPVLAQGDRRLRAAVAGATMTTSACWVLLAIA